MALGAVSRIQAGIPADRLVCPHGAGHRSDSGAGPCDNGRPGEPGEPAPLPAEVGPWWRPRPLAHDHAPQARPSPALPRRAPANGSGARGSGGGRGNSEFPAQRRLAPPSPRSHWAICRRWVGLADFKSGGYRPAMEVVPCAQHGEGRRGEGGREEGRGRPEGCVCGWGLRGAPAPALTGSPILRPAGSLCFLKTGVRDGPNKGKSFYVCGAQGPAACGFVLPAPWVQGRGGGGGGKGAFTPLCGSSQGNSVLCQQS